MQLANWEVLVLTRLVAVAVSPWLAASLATFSDQLLREFLPGENLAVPRNVLLQRCAAATARRALLGGSDPVVKG